MPSWLEIPAASDFPLENLPFGVIVRGGEQHVAVAIGDHALDLNVVARTGLLDGAIERDALLTGSLNALLEKKKPAWSGLRYRVMELLRGGNNELDAAGCTAAALVSRADVHNALPIAVADYVDFYASIEHAANLGSILRPGGEALLDNYRWMPVGYHGRAGTVVVSGATISRPRGQHKAPLAAAPVFGPSAMLDFELEIGFITGDANQIGGSLRPEAAMSHIFGVVLLNDWSARDIQAWEYQPLGPFLGKSFATTISPWVVTLDALEPFRVDGPLQEPPPLPHLQQREPRAYDIALQASVRSAAMRETHRAAYAVAQPNFRTMYWSMGQMLAHLSSNGSRVRAGDLFGSGTVSSTRADSYGSLIELTWRGREPLYLPDGSTRSFLEDGDEVILSGAAQRDGMRIGFGEARGTVVEP